MSDDYEEIQPGVLVRMNRDRSKLDVGKFDLPGGARLRIDIGDGSTVHIRDFSVKASGFLQIGAGCLMRNASVRIVGPRTGIRIGDNFSCGVTRLIAVYHDIRIGNGVLFSQGITVRSSDMHSIIDMESGERINPARPVRIHDRVWVGQDALVGKGVTIGTGSVVAGRAMVVSDVGENTLVGGVPAKVLRTGIRWENRDTDPRAE